jgi:hypothetical protein
LHKLLDGQSHLLFPQPEGEASSGPDPAAGGQKDAVVHSIWIKSETQEAEKRFPTWLVILGMMLGSI